MTQDAVLNWDRIIHKNVRCGDRQDAGNVIFVSGDSIRIMQGASRQYDVPKSRVDEFNGSEVILDFPFSELGKYKVH